MADPRAMALSTSSTSMMMLRSQVFDLLQYHCGLFVLQLFRLLKLELGHKVARFVAQQLSLYESVVNYLLSSPSLGTLEDIEADPVLFEPSTTQNNKNGNEDIEVYEANEKEEDQENSKRTASIDMLVAKLVTRDLLSDEALAYDQEFQERQTGRHLQSSAFCTLCANGGAPDLTTGLETYVPDVGFTECANAFTLVESTLAIPLDSIDCTNIQISAYARCGCPSLPEINPNIQCNMCGGGGKTPSYDINHGRFLVEFPPADDPIDCMTQLIYANTASNGVNCEAMQFSLETYCGCPNAPETTPPCSLCKDGAPLPDPDMIILPGDVTCAQVQDIANDPDVTTQCEALQNTAGVYCGCEANDPDAAGVKRICPDSALLPDPTIGFNLEYGDSRFTFKINTSCGLLEYTGNYNGDILVRYGNVCDCFGSDDAQCTLCSDGSEDYVQSSSIQLAVGFNVDCASFVELKPSFPLSGTGCQVFQEIGYLSCGCPTRPVPTPLEAGQTRCSPPCPLEDLNRDGFVYLPDVQQSCDILHAFATYATTDDEECADAQDHARYCCQSLPAFENPCSLCADPSSSFESDGPICFDFSALYCSNLYEEVPFLLEASSDRCTLIQEVGFFACGCSTPPEKLPDDFPCDISWDSIAETCFENALVGAEWGLALAQHVKTQEECYAAQAFVDMACFRREEVLPMDNGEESRLAEVSMFPNGGNRFGWVIVNRSGELVAASPRYLQPYVETVSQFTLVDEEEYYFIFMDDAGTGMSRNGRFVFRIQDRNDEEVWEEIAIDTSFREDAAMTWSIQEFDLLQETATDTPSEVPSLSPSFLTTTLPTKMQMRKMNMMMKKSRGMMMKKSRGMKKKKNMMMMKKKKRMPKSQMNGDKSRDLMEVYLTDTRRRGVRRQMS